MIVDVHCHYSLTRQQIRGGERFAFEPPAASDADPTFYDSCIAPRAVRRAAFLGLRWLLRLGFDLPPGAELDRRLEAAYERHLLAPGPIDRYVLLAFDAYHDEDGCRPPLPETFRQPGSDIYTSNSLVRALCARQPERYLFGASIHPYRPDALDALAEVRAAGAVLVKWLPLHQNIDAADPRTEDFLRACAALRLPVLVHYSEEFTLATNHPELQPLAPFLRLLRRLRRAGALPPVIVAHAATPVWPWGERGSHEALLDALAGEFSEEPLYADISALTAAAKVGFLRRLARRQELHHKLLFGSDFPIPPAAFRLRRDLGREFRAIAAEPSWTQQSARLVRAVGFNEIVLHRAADVLSIREGIGDARPAPH